MIRTLFFLLFVFYLNGIAFGANFGPVSSQVGPGYFSLTGGYQQYGGDWEEDDSTGVFEDMELRQSRVYLQGGVGLMPGWELCFRAGLANLQAEDAYRFQRNTDFRAPLRPFAGVGLKGRLYRGDMLSIGLFADGDYYSPYEDEEVVTGAFVATTERIEEKITLENMWMANAGLVFQGEVEGAILYGGPFFFMSSLEKASKARGLTTGIRQTIYRDIEEKNNAGLFVGILWTLKKDVFLDLELQYKSSMALGLNLTSKF